MQLSEVIREISVDLNDQELGLEYTRWTVAQIQSYVREGLTAIGRSLKDLFTKRVIVKVRPGAGWQGACDCTSIIRIVGETDANGNLLRYLGRSLDVEGNTWAGPVTLCAVDPKTYTMMGYAVSDVDDSQFRISPPMPPGVTRYVLIECYVYPTGQDLSSDVPDEVVAIVKQWALYRALSVDSENNPSIVNLAQTHYKSFNDLFQNAIAQREMEKRDAGNLRNLPNTPSK